MEIRIEKKPLAGILAHAAKVSAKRAGMVALETVKLEAMPDGRVVVSATDLELGYTHSTPAKSSKPGALLVDAKVFADVVRAAPTDEVHLERKGNVLVVRSGKSTWRLAIADAALFPGVDAGKAERFLDCAKHDLRVAIRRVLYAVSDEETRHALCGVLFEPHEGRLVLVATDGHRMAKDELEEGSAPLRDSWLQAPVIVPSKGVEELLRLLDENSGAGSLGMTGSALVYQHEGVRLSVRLIDGRYPAWRDVWREGAMVLEVPRVPFLATLRRMTILGDATKAMRLTIEGGVITLSRTDPDKGESVEEVEPVRPPDFTARIGFAGAYMREACDSFSGETVELMLGDELHPIVVRDPGAKVIGQHGAIIMPMRA
jgi:DNA polymerase-3 subunit beta